LLDDSGGLSGFADFLGTVYESEDKKERDELRAWRRVLDGARKRLRIKGYCSVIEIQGERWSRKNLSGNQMKY